MTCHHRFAHALFRRFSLVAFIALLSSVALPGAAFAQRASSGTLTGVVTARGTGQPIAGATISISGSDTTATTNDLGRFQIEGIANGIVSVVARARGFLDGSSQSISVSAGSPANVVFELDATPNYLERVQVTATKTPLSIGEVAAQTDVVDRATLDQRNDQTLTQAVARLPGAVVSTQLGIFESVMLRGLPRGDPEFTNTLLLVDGVPQTTSANASRVVALTIDDASSIEVVRGPNSALYGRTAIGGSINVRTADPTPERQIEADVTGGQFGTFKGVAKFSGPINERAGYLVSVGNARNGGFYRTKTGGDFSDETTSIFGKLTFLPDANALASLTFNHVNSDNSTPTNEPIIDGQLLHEIEPRFDRLTNFNIPGPNYLQREDRVTFNYTRQLTPRAKLVEVFGFRSVKQKFENDGDFIGSPFDLDAHTVEMYPFSQELREKIAFQELRAEFTPTLKGMRNTLTVGGSYERTAGSIDADFLFTDEDNEGIPINYLNPVVPPQSEWSHDVQPARRYGVGISALFAQYIIEPSSRWVFTAAGRYDRFALKNTPEGGATLNYVFDAFSPKASATYQVLKAEDGRSSTFNVYGAYSHAFLPPRRPSSLTPANVDLKLQPENIDNVEGGIKSSLLNGRVSLDGAYFWMTENGVVLTRRQGPFFLPTNSGEQRYKGVESSVRVTVTPQVSLFMNAAFYRNRFGTSVIESAGDDDTVLTGHRLPISPDSVLNWGAVFSPTTSVDATISVKRMGTVQADRDNTFTIDAYTLVDASVSWRRGPLRLTLSGNNLLNQEYYWNADGETADPGRPRQILFTTSVRFR